ncbi:unnamed protein product [Diabrotica balteata]|uniref:Phlebovirus glycoprotein G2 fusion domain-containing protein n=1 Tax=Diabrotica balteata TaxID=107213 RepID=A0A9N9TD53_DIABA|nr:unnamed protein product [Diabrotica balteata]
MPLEQSGKSLIVQPGLQWWLEAHMTDDTGKYRTNVTMQHDVITSWKGLDFEPTLTFSTTLPILGNKFMTKINYANVFMVDAQNPGQQVSGVLGQVQCRTIDHARDLLKCEKATDICTCWNSIETTSCDSKHAEPYNFALIDNVLPMDSGDFPLSKSGEHIFAEYPGALKAEILISGVVDLVSVKDDRKQFCRLKLMRLSFVLAGSNTELFLQVQTYTYKTAAECILAIIGPQLIPIKNIYDSNNIPDFIYQGDISNCEEDSVSAISPSSIEEIASTSTCSVLPNIIIRAEPTTSSKPKKRVRNPEKWKRNITKRKKCAGQEYETKSGKIVHSKSLKPFECKCKGRCSFLIPAERQMELHNNFYTLESFDLQTAYLFALIKVVNKLRSCTLNKESKRKKTRLYFLPSQEGVEHKVCKPFFQAVFQVSAGRLDILLKRKSIGTPPPCDKRGKHPPHNKTSDAKKMELKEFIEKFPWYESHYGREKSNHRKYLSPDLSLGKMYELYKGETQNPLSYFIFRETFNKEYNLHFHPPITDSCKKCDLFEVKIKAATSESSKNLETEKKINQNKAKSARDSLKRDTEMAKNRNASVICLDIMKTYTCAYRRNLLLQAAIMDLLLQCS